MPGMAPIYGLLSARVRRDQIPMAERMQKRRLTANAPQTQLARRQGAGLSWEPAAKAQFRSLREVERDGVHRILRLKRKRGADPKQRSEPDRGELRQPIHGSASASAAAAKGPPRSSMPRRMADRRRFRRSSGFCARPMTTSARRAASSAKPRSGEPQQSLASADEAPCFWRTPKHGDPQPRPDVARHLADDHPQRMTRTADRPYPRSIQSRRAHPGAVRRIMSRAPPLRDQRSEPPHRSNRRAAVRGQPHRGMIRAFMGAGGRPRARRSKRHGY